MEEVPEAVVAAPLRVVVGTTAREAVVTAEGLPVDGPGRRESTPPAGGRLVGDDVPRSEGTQGSPTTEEPRTLLGVHLGEAVLTGPTPSLGGALDTPRVGVGEGRQEGPKPKTQVATLEVPVTSSMSRAL